MPANTGGVEEATSAVVMGEDPPKTMPLSRYWSLMVVSSGSSEKVMRCE